MLNIQINTETSNPEKMADMLRRIADMVEDGNIAGHYPNWTLNEDSEPISDEG